MKTENAVLMKMARESLKGKWGLVIGTFVVYFLIIGAMEGAIRHFPISGLLYLLISGPMALGVAIFSLSLSRGQEARFEQIFKGFNNFKTSLKAYLLVVLFTLLWLLLLIIPDSKLALFL